MSERLEMGCSPRKLNVFLSYASQDATKVRELYRRLSAEPWISIWFDKEALLPGQGFLKGLSDNLSDALILRFLPRSARRTQRKL
jgi:hypothetical protein